MTGSKPSSTTGSFLLQRFLRVAPFYYLMTSVVLYQALFYKGLSFDRIWNSFAFLPLFDSGKFTNPIHEFGWSLCFEMTFYLVFAAILVLARNRVLTLLPAFFLVGTVVNLVVPPVWYFLDFLFNPMTLEFSLGVLLYRYRQHLHGKVLLLPALVLTLSPWLLHGTSHLGFHLEVLASRELSWQRFLHWGLPAAAFVMVILAADLSQKVRWPRWLVLLGDASFSVYLIQPYTLTFAIRLGHKLDLPSTVRALVFLGATLVGGLALYHLAEKPLIRFLRSRIPARWISSGVSEARRVA